MIVKQGLVYFDSEESLSCILRDRWKNVRTVVVSQSNLKSTGHSAGTILYISSFDRKCKFALVSRRSAGPPSARGPIRRNRLETGPVPIVHAVGQIYGSTAVSVFQNFGKSESSNITRPYWRLPWCRLLSKVSVNYRTCVTNTTIVVTWTRWGNRH